METHIKLSRNKLRFNLLKYKDALTLVLVILISERDTYNFISISNVNQSSNKFNYVNLACYSQFTYSEIFVV